MGTERQDLPTPFRIPRIQPSVRILLESSLQKDPRHAGFSSRWTQVPLHYPFYYRWSDAYNVSTEFTILELARGLATSLKLMAKTSLRSQPWRPLSGTIAIRENSAQLKIQNPPAEPPAMIVWQSDCLKSPVSGQELELGEKSPTWITAEAHWHDGRRVFAIVTAR